jgi:hypothetical protein
MTYRAHDPALRLRFTEPLGVPLIATCGWRGAVSIEKGASAGPENRLCAAFVLMHWAPAEAKR